MAHENVVQKFDAYAARLEYTNHVTGKAEKHRFATGSDGQPQWFISKTHAALFAKRVEEHKGFGTCCLAVPVTVSIEEQDEEDEA